MLHKFQKLDMQKDRGKPGHNPVGCFREFPVQRSVQSQAGIGEKKTEYGAYPEAVSRSSHPEKKKKMKQFVLDRFSVEDPEPDIGIRMLDTVRDVPSRRERSLVEFRTGIKSQVVVVDIRGTRQRPDQADSMNQVFTGLKRIHADEVVTRHHRVAVLMKGLGDCQDAFRWHAAVIDFAVHAITAALNPHDQPVHARVREGLEFIFIERLRRYQYQKRSPNLLSVSRSELVNRRLGLGKESIVIDPETFDLRISSAEVCQMSNQIID